MTPPATPETRHRCASDPLADRVAQACAQEFGVTVEQIYAKGRTEPVATARQLAMYLLQTEFGVGVRQSGEMFGRLHPTGVNARDNVRDWLDAKDQVIVERLGRLRVTLQPKPAYWVI